MIITDDFVLLNFPKTGSSFARDAIKKAYKSRKSLWRKIRIKLGLAEPVIQELFFRHPFVDAVDQHGTVHQIPARYLQRKMVSIVREPVDRYLSMYHYRWWAKNPPASIDIIKKVYPAFPDIDFVEFLEMMNTYGIKQRLGNMTVGPGIGLQTVQFVQFFFKDPDRVLSNLNEEYLSANRFRDDIFPVHFIHQENLNSELKAFLIAEAGFDASELAFLDTAEKVNRSERTDNRESVPMPLVEKIHAQEALLYRIFPEYLNRDAHE